MNLPAAIVTGFGREATNAERELLRANVRIANLEIENEEMTEQIHTLKFRLKAIGEMVACDG